jgi:hypothetical protein
MNLKAKHFHDVKLKQNTYTQGYFCDGTCWNAVPEVLSQRDASCNGIPESFFPCIGITKTTPLRPNFGSLFAFWNLFQKKNSAAYTHTHS